MKKFLHGKRNYQNFPVRFFEVFSWKLDYLQMTTFIFLSINSAKRQNRLESTFALDTLITPRWVVFSKICLKTEGIELCHKERRVSPWGVIVQHVIRAQQLLAKVENINTPLTQKASFNFLLISKKNLLCHKWSKYNKKAICKSLLTFELTAFLNVLPRTSSHHYTNHYKILFQPKHFSLIAHKEQKNNHVMFDLGRVICM